MYCKVGGPMMSVLSGFILLSSLIFLGSLIRKKNFTKKNILYLVLMILAVEVVLVCVLWFQFHLRFPIIVIVIQLGTNAFLYKTKGHL